MEDVAYGESNSKILSNPVPVRLVNILNSLDCLTAFTGYNYIRQPLPTDLLYTFIPGPVLQSIHF